MGTINRQPEPTADAPQSASARLLHPEDVSVGDDVALAIQSYDYPSFLWSMGDPTTMPPSETVRLNFIPEPVNKPLKVVAVCLPFVLCEQVNGKFVTYDVRTTQLMRLATDFAATARMNYASKKRRKALKATGVGSAQAKINQGEINQGEMPGQDVPKLLPAGASDEPITVDGLTQVVLFEFSVQVPLADAEDIGGFFSVVVSQS